MIIVSVLLISFQINHVYAYESKLNEYTDIIREVNEKYNTSFYLLTETDFYKYDYDQIFNKNYDVYLNDIKNTDLKTFENELLQLAIDSREEIIDTNINAFARSILGTKTILFFSGNNSMTLRYKYSGKIFDTSYKPSVTVNKINNTMYFVMNSYSGKFTNSNKTYSVVANGRIISSVGIVGNKTFTVNFNL